MVRLPSVICPSSRLLYRTQRRATNLQPASRTARRPPSAPPCPPAQPTGNSSVNAGCSTDSPATSARDSQRGRERERGSGVTEGQTTGQTAGQTGLVARCAAQHQQYHQHQQPVPYSGAPRRGGLASRNVCGFPRPRSRRARGKALFRASLVEGRACSRGAVRRLRCRCRCQSLAIGGSRGGEGGRGNPSREAPRWRERRRPGLATSLAKIKNKKKRI
ncbi:hypothetical protein AOQ84DRAFT_199012 [Glonium stellatum]|uniref:Uncharacterized protein n=1 Tax=Glonium stellatum TaxID=574774 RepID=A0A8E2EP06_9PEZI|nr:hypothetical protein AOQ84DRAFT_199012 [Glonium stellatum]